jgi:hypothetical protein
MKGAAISAIFNQDTFQANWLVRFRMPEMNRGYWRLSAFVARGLGFEAGRNDCTAFRPSISC